MLDGLLLATGEGFGIIPLCVLMIRAEPILEPGFKNEVQDTPGCQSRLYVVLVVQKFSWGTSLLLNSPHTTVSAKTEGIFTLELPETLHPLDLSSDYLWVCASGVEKPWHVSRGLLPGVGGHKRFICLGTRA